MSEKITSANLDIVVEQNKQIHDEILKKVQSIQINTNQMMVKSSAQHALQLLKQHGLIQLPVDNPYFSGAIFVRDAIRVPVINTAIPRANQYFTAWHEIYHLYFDEVSFNHFIETESIMEERKADYFSSLMLLGNLLPYFNTLPETDFLSKVFQCMDTFQVPYKAVLISLYESAFTNGNEQIMQAVKQYFDLQFTDIESRFRALGLDDTLVQPSNIVNLGQLTAKIHAAQKYSPELSYHTDNKHYLDDLISEINLVMGEPNA